MNAIYLLVCIAAATAQSVVKIEPGTYHIVSSEPEHGFGKFLAAPSSFFEYIDFPRRVGGVAGGLASITAATMAGLSMGPFAMPVGVIAGTVATAAVIAPFHFYLRSKALVLSWSRRVVWTVKSSGNNDNTFTLHLDEEEEKAIGSILEKNGVKLSSQDPPVVVLATEAPNGSVYLQIYTTEEGSSPAWLYAKDKKKVRLSNDFKTTWRFIPVLQAELLEYRSFMVRVTVEDSASRNPKFVRSNCEPVPDQRFCIRRC